MPKKKCGFGFNCGTMMMQPGLETGDCPNYQTCGSATELTPEEEVELILVREEQRRVWEEENRRWHEEQERIQERIRVTRHQAAVMMLMARGCPQSLESLDVAELLVRVESRLAELRSRLSEQFGEDVYIAPVECEAHRYNVKRPGGVYWYNKLTAEEPVFEPSERESKVRVIHLSHDDDPRNIQARAGIQRRNQLVQLNTQLRLVERALADALN